MHFRKLIDQGLEKLGCSVPIDEKPFETGFQKKLKMTGRTGVPITKNQADDLKKEYEYTYRDAARTDDIQ